MKTKEKTRRSAKSCVEEKLFPEMKESYMSPLNQKIHDLLMAEGFFYEEAKSERVEVLKCNNYRKLSRAVYERMGLRLRSEKERVILIIHEPSKKP